jgi:hypothetical protein
MLFFIELLQRNRNAILIVAIAQAIVFVLRIAILGSHGLR